MFNIALFNSYTLYSKVSNVKKKSITSFRLDVAEELLAKFVDDLHMVIHLYNCRLKIGDIFLNTSHQQQRSSIRQKDAMYALKTMSEVRQPGSASSARYLYICQSVLRSIIHLLITNITQETAMVLLKHGVHCEKRGMTNLKNKGLRPTYYVCLDDKYQLIIDKEQNRTCDSPKIQEEPQSSLPEIVLHHPIPTFEISDADELPYAPPRGDSGFAEFEHVVEMVDSISDGRQKHLLQNWRYYLTSWKGTPSLLMESSLGKDPALWIYQWEEVASILNSCGSGQKSLPTNDRRIMEEVIIEHEDTARLDIPEDISPPPRPMIKRTRSEMEGMVKVEEKVVKVKRDIREKNVEALNRLGDGINRIGEGLHKMGDGLNRIGD
ncbi:hypothetical protein J437_LFUL010536, partial [Ladona fulva]